MKSRKKSKPKPAKHARVKIWRPGEWRPSTEDMMRDEILSRTPTHYAPIPGTGIPMPQVRAEHHNRESTKAAVRDTKQKPLTGRENKLWEIIRRGLNATPPLRGTAYCREVDAAKITPPRKGIWNGGPRTYEAAYKSGDLRLVHWIQNEKSKIKRKAESSETR